MIDFLGGILELAFSIVEMVLGLVFGALELVFGILGGVASLLLSLAGVAVIALLVIVFIRRRSSREPERSDVLVDENGETFTSFYHQHEE